MGKRNNYIWSPTKIYKDDQFYYLGIDNPKGVEGIVVKFEDGISKNGVVYQIVTIVDSYGKPHRGYHYVDEYIKTYPVEIGEKGIVQYENGIVSGNLIGFFEPIK